MAAYIVKYWVKVSEFRADGSPNVGPNLIYGQVKVPADSEMEAAKMFWRMHRTEPHLLGEALDTSEWEGEFEDVRAAIEDCIQVDDNIAISEFVKG